MSDAWRTVDIDGDIDPARSRQMGRRSAVTLTDEYVVVGTAMGAVVASDRRTLGECWRVEPDSEAAVVSITSLADSVVIGERGAAGAIRAYDLDSGTVRWRYATATDVGAPKQRTRFFLPFVVDFAVDDDRVYAAARRYERDGDRRSFSSVVYAFDADGTIAWTYETDASPISVAVRDGRVAVAYNRCPGEHHHGLVVLDTEDGTIRYRWDPPADGQRRVGDVSLLDTGAVVTSHADYRGYRIGPGGTEWRIDLATAREIDGETVYAYPNHVHATDDGAVFVTGNTYPEEGRETAVLHPDEQTAVGVSPEGIREWSTSVGGFAAELATAADTVVVPSAQQFRTRDPGVHGLSAFDVATGTITSHQTAGIATAVALEGETVAAVEEPVVYHDEGRRRGAYRLLVGSL
ncbi:outer membrane protein assembly factor BamB family protein [Halocatena salina]|uniref:PQQ-binding-like beta-propeller repeat protein n=1 Tax=Halocatena salina TaxID=2934340 RepID=A0A8U0A105_9EURY|nr:PQQ-binding-like beta-propeller repeat protein [Halocatena salina]UPM42815.1 PQQ-binding-like beta-propeller repeat protein [Halocatena salina]